MQKKQMKEGTLEDLREYVSFSNCISAKDFYLMNEEG